MIQVFPRSVLPNQSDSKKENLPFEGRSKTSLENIATNLYRNLVATKEPIGPYKIWVCDVDGSKYSPSNDKDLTQIGLEGPDGQICFYKKSDTSKQTTWYETVKQFALESKHSELPTHETIDSMSIQGVRQITKDSYTLLKQQFECDLNDMQLKGPFKLVFAKHILKAISDNKPVQLNLKTNRIEETQEFSENEALLLTQKLYGYLQKVKVSPDGDLSNDNQIVLDLALRLLDSLNTRALNGGISNKSLEKKMIQLDRVCAFLELKEQATDVDKFTDFFCLLDDETSRKQLTTIKDRLKTDLGKEDFINWCFEKTSSARKKNLEEYIMTPKVSAVSYFFQPESVEFLKNLRLNRAISALNHEIQLDLKTNDLLILYEGNYIPVSEILDDFHFIQDHIITSDGEEFFYFDETGLSKGSPVNWDDPPLFIKKNKTRKEPHLEICTTFGKMVHSYINLKGINGEVYSIGKLWDRNYDIPRFEELFKTIPSMLRMDPHKYLPDEKNFKKTKIQLTLEKYDEILDFIKNLQKDCKTQEVGFNLTHLNCNSFVKKVAKIAGVDMGYTKINVIEFFLGKFISFNILLAAPGYRKFLFKHSWIRTAIDIILYPLLVFKNFVFFLGGASRKTGKDPLEKDVLFPFPFNDIFNPFSDSASVEHPLAIRTWQEIQEDKAQKASKG